MIRYNGGPQAGHNVVTDDGRHHTFSQFGAGSFVAGVETRITADVAVQPWAMIVEAAHLARAGVRGRAGRAAGRVAGASPAHDVEHVHGGERARGAP